MDYLPNRQSLTLTLVVFEFFSVAGSIAFLFCLTLTLVVFESIIAHTAANNAICLTLTLVVFEFC